MVGTFSININSISITNFFIQVVLFIIPPIPLTSLNCYTIGAESLKLQPLLKYNESVKGNT